MSSITSTSPSPPHQSSCATHAIGVGVGRRPSRKNTLTQQQKNQKRQRATQDQLVTLEAEFNKNPTPTAMVRERIAQQINMTERSVQIWFQNRRAKIKLMAKKSIENGEECDVPESMRLYLAQQAVETGKGIPRHLMDGRIGYGNALAPEPSPQRKLVIHHFNCRSLTIGSWRRIGQTTMDLVIFYCPDRACITYYINNDSAGYKIEYPFSFIKSIELETIESPANTLNKQGQIVVTLTRPPLFFMDSSGCGGFYQCMDFTEKQQASEVLVHYLGGHPKTLAQQLAKLTTLDAFINRHAQQISPQLAFYDQHPFNASSPQTPGIVRPASSNGIMTPQNYHSEVPNNFFQKHKRQRSRSVPTALDFSTLPNFSFHETQDQLFAPAPQHTSNRLTIDTTQSGFLDYRGTSYPLSAATTSPSDYASPNLMNSTLQSDVNSSAGYGSPYSVPYLSPSVDPQTMLGSSVSPLLMGNGEPMIADSPQLDMMGVAATDLYAMVQDETLFADDGMELSDLYSKQLTTDSPEFLNTEDMESQLMQFPLSQQLAL